MEGSPNLDQIAVVNMSDASHSNFLEIDEKFLTEINEISQKKASTMKSFCQESEISEEKCDQIVEYARIHAQANIFNSTSMMDFRSIKTDQTKEFCSCGCKKGVGQYLPLCINEQNFTFLGPGILLFFFYLKHIRVILVFILISYGGFSFITNVLSLDSPSQNLCENKYFIQQWLCQLNAISTYNLKQANLFRYFQLWMGLIVALLWFFGVKFIQFLGYRKDEQIDEFLDSASDYTMRIQNLPFGEYNEKQLIQFIQELWITRYEVTPNTFTQCEENSGEKLDLQSIQIIYNMEQCRDLIAKIKNLSYQLTFLIEEENKIIRQNIPIYKSKKAQLKAAFEQIQQLRSQFLSDDEFRKKISTTCALVEFKSAEQQKEFLSQYEKKEENIFQQLCSQENKYKFKGTEIVFQRAPEPSDFMWSNCEIRFSYLRYAGIWAITALVLYVAYALISFVQTLDVVKQNAGMVISIILQVFNRIIWFTLSFLVTFEYHNTKTESIISLMKKSIFAQVINVIVTPIINMYVNNKPLYGEGSLSGMVLNYQFVSFFMMTIFYLMSPTFFFKKIVKFFACLRRKMIRILCVVVGEIDTIDEIRPVLSFYEGAQFPMAGAYVYMTTVIFHTLFYCHIQPILLLIVICNLTGFYIILKYLLLRRCKIPELTSVKIFECALSAIGYGSWIYCIGTLFFLVIEKYNNFSRYNQIDILQLLPASLGLLICIILNFNPLNVIQKMNNFLYEYFAFDLEFMKMEKKQNKEKVNEIVHQIFFSNMDQSKASLSHRRESYYKNSNAHKLFNYEAELKEIANQAGVQRNKGLKKFCQSFFSKSVKSLKDLTDAEFGEDLNDDLMEMILIPALQIHKKRKQSQSEKVPETHKEENFRKAQTIITKLFASKTDQDQ